MLIPYSDLSKEALDGLIAQYITQEHGTNDVENPVTLYYQDVYRALVDGRLVVVFSQWRNTSWLSATN